MTTTLSEAELRNIATSAHVDPAIVAAVLAEAQARDLIVLLPPAPERGDFPGWGAFAFPGSAKCAHLCEKGAWRAFCGVARPFTSVTPPARSRLCSGCAYHAERLRANPDLIATYDRGRAPREFSVATPPTIVPRAGSGAPPAAQQEREPSATPSRVRAHVAPTPDEPPTPVHREAPEAVVAERSPSLFDEPAARAPRRRPTAAGASR